MSVTAEQFRQIFIPKSVKPHAIEDLKEEVIFLLLTLMDKGTLEEDLPDIRDIYMTKLNHIKSLDPAIKFDVSIEESKLVVR